MNEKYIEIRFAVPEKEQGELVIACISEMMETEGFEEEDGFVRAYVTEQAFNLPALQDFAGTQKIDFSVSVFENKNWNAIWESEFEPVIIDDFVAIRAHFHPAIGKMAHEIIITPKMSFGTGHHATTTLMIESMRQYGCTGKKIADFGTGTGILAILGEKMGAREVLAIDHDEWSIENAGENIGRNGSKNIRLLKADHFPEEGLWDMILANVNLSVITDNLRVFHESLNDKGRLIVSGILQKDESEIIISALSLSFITEGIKRKNNWICLVFKKSSGRRRTLIIKKSVYSQTYFNLMLDE